jgi:hypothetical protein
MIFKAIVDKGVQGDIRDLDERDDENKKDI